MSCSACGHENPPGNRFCGGCDVALAKSCPSCAHPNPSDHRFCGACGAALMKVESPKSKVENPHGVVMNLLDIVRAVRRHSEENGRLPGTECKTTQQRKIGFLTW